MTHFNEVFSSIYTIVYDPIKPNPPGISKVLKSVMIYQIVPVFLLIKKLIKLFYNQKLKRSLSKIDCLVKLL